MATLESIEAQITALRSGLIAKFSEIEAKIDALDTQIENLELISYTICTMCQGSGEVIPSYNMEGEPPGAITCPSCNGEGRETSGSADEKD